MALGAAMGVVYDCFRVFRILFPPASKGGAVAVQDIIFWLIYGIGIFCYSAVICRGELRFFTFLGSLIGFTLYIVTLGNAVVGILRRTVSAFCKILRKVYSALFEPIVKIIKEFCQKVYAVFVRNHKNIKNIKRSKKIS